MEKDQSNFRKRGKRQKKKEIPLSIALCVKKGNKLDRKSFPLRIWDFGFRLKVGFFSAFEIFLLLSVQYDQPSSTNDIRPFGYIPCENCCKISHFPVHDSFQIFGPKCVVLPLANWRGYQTRRWRAGMAFSFPSFICVPDTNQRQIRGKQVVCACSRASWINTRR